MINFPPPNWPVMLPVELLRAVLRDRWGSFGVLTAHSQAAVSVVLQEDKAGNAA